MKKYDPADFFTRLYRGFEAEHFVAGKLFGCGLEALKMPGDFGFDLLVDNQMERALKSQQSARVTAFPYAIQVKSRKISERRRKMNGSRWEYRVNFDISTAEYELLVSHPASFLVCVALSGYGLPSAEVDYFWLSGQQVRALKDSLYFLPKTGTDGKDYLRLQAVVRERNSQAKKDVIAGVLDRIGDSVDASKVKEYLSAALPSRIESNDNSSEYISLERPCGNQKMGNGPFWERFHTEVGEDGQNGKATKIDALQLDLARLGETPIFPVDDPTMARYNWPIKASV